MKTFPKLVIGILLAFYSLNGQSQVNQVYEFEEGFLSVSDSQLVFPPYRPSMEVFPRSASDNTQITLSSILKCTCKAQILDMGDEVWKTKELSVLPGAYSVTISLYEIPPGWYWVKVTCQEGRETLFSPLLIER